MESNFELFDFMSIFVPIMTILVFAIVIISMISPKFRGKIISRNIKAMKYAIDESENDLKTINDKTASSSADAITTKARAFKKGFKNEVYCKHCGYLIDSDSIFCKKCGKKQ